MLGEKQSTNDEKHFDEWNALKKRLHNLGQVPRFNEGEVYWCGFGENIGIEINGKHKMFSRPVLVYKKLSRFGFLGVPLSSKTYHEGSWYVPFRFQGKMQVAVLAQVRTFSIERLYGKMGQIDELDMQKIKRGFGSLYC